MIMTNKTRSIFIAIGVASALGSPPALADGFWSFDEQWWKDALTKPVELRSSEMSVPTDPWIGSITPPYGAEPTSSETFAAESGSSEAFVPTARTSERRSAYSFLDDYNP